MDSRPLRMHASPSAMKPKRNRHIALGGVALASAAVLSAAAVLFVPDWAGSPHDGFARWRWELGVGLIVVPIAFLLGATALCALVCWVSDSSRSGPFV